MKSQNKGTAFRKWSRIIHRDLSFFFAGMILIYAISGIVMNHRDSINPHYTVTRTEYKITEDLSDKSKVNEKMILTLLEPLGEAGNFTKYYYPEPDLIKVFLKGGSSLVINKHPDKRCCLRGGEAPSADLFHGTTPFQSG